MERISMIRNGKRSIPQHWMRGVRPAGFVSIGTGSMSRSLAQSMDVNVAGATAVFETSIDDYAEIWIDGELSRALGQSGGSVMKGWNAANRLIINRSVQPGQKIQLAIFGKRPALKSADQLHLHARGEARVLQRRRCAGRTYTERSQRRSDSQRPCDGRDRAAESEDFQTGGRLQIH